MKNEEPPPLPNLVILDDNGEFVEFLAEVGESLDFQVMKFVSPFEFIKAKLPEDSIVVLDLEMPGLDGIRVLRYIARLKNHPRAIILISSHGTHLLKPAQVLAQELNLNIAGYLSKPVPLREISALLTSTRDSVVRATANLTENHSHLLAELINAVTMRQIDVHFQPIYASDGETCSWA